MCLLRLGAGRVRLRCTDTVGASGKKATRTLWRARHQRQRCLSMARRTWPPLTEIPKDAARRIAYLHAQREAAGRAVADACRARDAAILAALRDGGITGPEAAAATGLSRAIRIVTRVRDGAGLSQHANPEQLRAIAAAQRDLAAGRREKTAPAVAAATQRRRELVLEAIEGGGITGPELAGVTGITTQAAHKLIQKVRTHAGLPRHARPEHLVAIADAQRALDAATERARRADAALRELICTTQPMSHRALAGLLGYEGLDRARRLRGGHRRSRGAV